MFIAMNRFALRRDVNRISRASGGIDSRTWKKFRGSSNSTCCGARQRTARSYASHSVWKSRKAFEDWTNSESFRKAHGQARAPEGTYLGPPQFEGFDVVL
jgi:heme-degrading monooxygenase HmoA